MTRAAGEAALDPDAVDNVEARLAEVRSLRQVLFGTGSPTRLDDADELEAEERRLVEYLRLGLRLDGRVRRLGDQAERVRKRVGNAITRALALIGDDDAALAAHLTKPVLTTGGTISYQPGPGTTWSMGD